jgi:hypothetical protein
MIPLEIAAWAVIAATAAWGLTLRHASAVIRGVRAEASGEIQRAQAEAARPGARGAAQPRTSQLDGRMPSGPGGHDDPDAVAARPVRPGSHGEPGRRERQPFLAAGSGQGAPSRQHDLTAGGATRAAPARWSPAAELAGPHAIQEAAPPGPAERENSAVVAVLAIPYPHFAARVPRDLHA